MKKISNYVIIIEFCFMILIPIMGFNFKEGKVSAAENKTLASFPDIIDSDGNIQLGSALIKELVTWFDENLGGREQAIVCRRNILKNIFNQSPNSQVQYGYDGWLFYTKDDNLSIANGTYSGMEDKNLIKIQQELEHVEISLQKQGIDFVFALPPSKVSIYPEYIQSGRYCITSTPCDILSGYLNENSNVKVIDFKSRLIDEKYNMDELLYFKTDTHWSYVGRYIGYETIVDSFNKWGLLDDDPIRVSWIDSSWSGDLTTLISGAGEEEACKEYKIENQTAEQVTDGSILDKISKFGKTGKVYLNSSLLEGKTILIFGDSMVGNCILPLLAENFKEIVFVRSYKFEQEIIDSVEPDIVMLAVSERNLNQLPDCIGGY